MASSVLCGTVLLMILILCLLNCLLYETDAELEVMKIGIDILFSLGQDNLFVVDNVGENLIPLWMQHIEESGWRL